RRNVPKPRIAASTCAYRCSVPCLRLSPDFVGNGWDGNASSYGGLPVFHLLPAARLAMAKGTVAWFHYAGQARCGSLGRDCVRGGITSSLEERLVASSRAGAFRVG